MKKVLLTIGLCLFLFTGLMTGCQEQSANSEEVNRIVANVLEAKNTVDNYKVELSILQDFRVENAADYMDIPDAMTVINSGDGALDLVNEKMQMNLTTNVKIAGESKQSATMETYLVNGYVYSKYPTSEGDMEWVKMDMPENMWDKQNQLFQKLEILETSDSIKYLGEENIDGVECYVVEINPDENAIEKMLSQLDMPVTSRQFKSNLSRILKKLLIKQWVSKDSYLIAKTKEHTIVELKPGDIGMESDGFKKMIVDYDIEIKFFEYNKQMSIELPAGALDAKEIME